MSLVDPAALQRTFGGFVVSVASQTPALEANAAVGTAAGFVTLLAMGMAFAGTVVRAHCPMRRMPWRHDSGLTAKGCRGIYPRG
ncbi:hypothetical protein Mycch_5666 (plasmid) [Mycolicibacterium chubuense NBB4]|uniref:Uncharacterized protein n=1 Tax=Mycolicibacterium chubuense (strain NBB4) TaxID=710421 RepID=I4BSP4_MYCCN|nr:hypothetical protein Mycch_5666 [Mycolicibacterium chubuense NBB4]